MSKYIHKENQKLLWSVSKKIPNITTIFPGILQRERWFSDVIELFYEQNKLANLSKNQLENLNKQTIQYMINSLKSYPTPQTTTKKVSFVPNDTISSPFSLNINDRLQDSVWNNNMLPVTPRSQTHQTESKSIPNELLESRQREYENMLKRETPQEPNFRESMEDTAIENMEELVQQQMRQRELDIATLSLITPPFIPNTIIPPLHSGISEVSKSGSLQIMEDMNIIDSLSISELNILPNTLPKIEKTTQMNEFINIFLEIKDEMKEIKYKMKEMNDEMKEIKEEMKKPLLCIDEKTEISSNHVTNIDIIEDKSSTD